MKDVQQPLQDRVIKREKTAFTLANFGNIPIMTLIGAYLLIFYTDVVGLDPAAVATLFLITRIFDGLNDPIMGYVVDHLPRTKMGRFRSYLIIGAIVCSLNYILLWFGPLWAPSGKLAIAYITYILIGITFDMMDIPLNSLIPAMTDNEKERSSLSIIKGISYVVGAMIVSVGAPLILSNAENQITAYYIIIFGAVALVLVCSIVGALGVRERIQPSKHNEKYSIKDVLRIITLHPVLALFASTLLFGVSTAAGSSSNIYFFTYILNNRLELLSVVSMVSLIGLVPAMAMSGLIVEKFGKKRTFTFGLLVFGLGPLLRLLNITHIPLLMISSILTGIGSGIIITVMYSLQADNVDFVEHKTNFRAEGCIASINSFVVKAGQGLGSAIPGYILAATGYVPNVAQAETAKFGIVLNTIIFPAVLALLASVVFGLGYNLTREEITKMAEELRERRKK